MPPEETTAAPPRVDLEQLRAADKARKEAATAGGQKIEHPDGRSEFRQKGKDQLSALEAARAGKGAAFPTFVSKAKRLVIMINGGGRQVIGTEIVETAPKYIQFENQLYTCQSQEEVDYLLNSKDLGRQYWSKADFLAMETAQKKRIAVEAVAHLKLVEKEMQGVTDPAHPGDADLAVGMQAGPDKARDKPNVPTDSDGLPVLLEDGG